MPRNIEIKAKVTDPEALAQRARSLADGPEEVLEQTDTFFHVAHGRLKLREFGDGSGELIHYHRADADGPKASEYVISFSADPASLKTALANALGVRAVVAKRRTLLMAGQTRIHLDRVEGLGHYMELEVVMDDKQTSEEGSAIADELMRRLGIASEDLVAGAYVDLLESVQINGVDEC